MSRFIPVALHHASRLINHGPTVLVTSAHGGRRNLMAAAWSMPVEFTPPRIAVVIDKKTFTRELVAASGVFGLCLPGIAMADLAYAVGSVSGREQDKFAHHAIRSHAGAQTGVPLIEDGCAAWLECRLISEPHTGCVRHLLRRSGGRRGRSARVLQRPLGLPRRQHGAADAAPPGRRQLRAPGRHGARRQVIVIPAKAGIQCFLEVR